MGKIIKETDKTIIAIDLMFYSIYIVVGYFLLKYPEIESLKPIQYVPALFYVMAFFSLLAYFLNRRKDNYEFLLLGLINILVATVVLYYTYYENSSFILGNAMLIFAIANVLNKGWHTIKLSRQGKIEMFSKFAITILLTLLGILVITDLYREISLQTLILGFYFLFFGILSLVEPIMVIALKSNKFRNYLTSLIYEEEKTKTKVKKTIKEIKKEPIKKKKK